MSSARANSSTVASIKAGNDIPWPLRFNDCRCRRLSQNIPVVSLFTGAPSIAPERRATRNRNNAAIVHILNNKAVDMARFGNRSTVVKYNRGKFIKPGDKIAVPAFILGSYVFDKFSGSLKAAW